MVLLTVHGNAFYTPHKPIVRRDPQNKAKIRPKSAVFIAFLNQVLRQINSFFMNDCYIVPDAFTVNIIVEHTPFTSYP